MKTGDKWLLRSEMYFGRRPAYTHFWTRKEMEKFWENYKIHKGTAVAQWLRYCATNRKVTGLIPDDVIGIFHWHKSFWSHYDPAVDSASNRNEYREYFLGGKCSQCIRLTTLPPSCAIVTKSGNLNFLEPSGQPRACNGTALPFTNYTNNNLQNIQDTVVDVMAEWALSEY
jgi:hypothetical protein